MKVDYHFTIFFCRILFPFLSNEDKNLSQHGHSRIDGNNSSDPEDYLSIESGTDIHTGMQILILALKESRYLFTLYLVMESDNYYIVFNC